MRPFIFRAEQFVSRPLDVVFVFFPKAENLQQPTPPWLHFRILSVEPALVREGTMIRYSPRCEDPSDSLDRRNYRMETTRPLCRRATDGSP
jgi:hypothetical protein